MRYNEDAITLLAILADRWARYLPIEPRLARACGWPGLNAYRWDGALVPNP